ncbi:hypothetical protein IC801_13140 [Geobacillus sp. 44B]|nr:hypothetical protein BSK33_15990 [Geobacillus sp. 44B]QNU36810.1 hypothetical protein IC801_13140 [Geobacillus sp. 44B]
MLRKIIYIYIISLAMKDAYEGESKLAKYPRIIIYPDSLEQVTNELFEFVTPSKTSLLIQGEDDLWFINPFFLGGNLKISAEQINKRIEKYKNEPYIDKYYWLADLQNIFVAPSIYIEQSRAYYKKEITYLKLLEQLYTTNDYAKRQLCITWQERETYNCFFFPFIRPYTFQDYQDGKRDIEEEFLQFRKVFNKSFLLNISS